MYLGHIVASYGLPFDDGEPDTSADAPWACAVRAAIHTTREAFGDANIVAYVDKKAFNSARRRAIAAVCAEQGVHVAAKRNDPLLKPSVIA